MENAFKEVAISSLVATGLLYVVGAAIVAVQTVARSIGG